ncbi:MAG: YbhB/YbcL family Raf kinase inhibitor-like protein [Patescibacteria group bacterium]
MKFYSSAFADQEEIPSHYTCDGQNISPPLMIDSVPAAAQTLAIIVYDPDAPSGDFVHWIIWNISPINKQLSENVFIPEATQGINDFAKPGWGGPCPPSGSHRYVFRLFALDTTLDLPDTATKLELKAAMEAHVLEEAQFTSTYQRQ